MHWQQCLIPPNLLAYVLPAARGAAGWRRDRFVTAKVLIAEDEANIARLLTLLMDRAGFESRWVADGQAVLEAARGFRPDVLILDIAMPSLSGYDVLKAVRADPGLSGLPVLMLTAQGHDHDRAFARSLGANAFISKPFSNIDVLSRVAELATGEI